MFYRWGRGGTERWSSLPEVTQLVWQAHSSSSDATVTLLLLKSSTLLGSVPGASAVLSNAHWEPHLVAHYPVREALANVLQVANSCHAPSHGQFAVSPFCCSLTNWETPQVRASYDASLTLLLFVSVIQIQMLYSSFWNLNLACRPIMFGPDYIKNNVQLSEMTTSENSGDYKKKSSVYGFSWNSVSVQDLVICMPA